MRKRTSLLVSVFLVLSFVSFAYSMEMKFVSVGNPGNPNDTHGDEYGRVDYVYQIGQYEVTNSQYCEFLNAVAASDPNGLYYIGQGGGWNDIGGITRTGESGSYTYAVRPNRGNRPVNDVSWYSTLRFANWMHNGQSKGEQNAQTTEDGAYDMSLGSSVTRKAEAEVFLPSQDEWYKAAYYDPNKDGTGGYWDYPTMSDVAPTSELPNGTDMINGSANYMSYGGSFLDEAYYTTEVGSYFGKPSRSAYGTFDQGGNVWEWSEQDLYGDGEKRVLHGGSFGAFAHHLCADGRGQLSASTNWFDVGFRVAAIPEPTTFVLLCTSCAMVMHRKRR